MVLVGFGGFGSAGEGYLVVLGGVWWFWVVFGGAEVV